jgi:hypothetical protein
MPSSFRYYDEAFRQICRLAWNSQAFLVPSWLIQCVGAPDRAPIIATTAFVLVEANIALSAAVGAISGRPPGVALLEPAENFPVQLRQPFKGNSCPRKN